VTDRDLLTEVRNLILDEEVTVSRLPVRTVDWVPELDEEPPEIGEHSRQVLREFGYDETEIDALVESESVFAP